MERKANESQVPGDCNFGPSHPLSQGRLVPHLCSRPHLTVLSSISCSLGVAQAS